VTNSYNIDTNGYADTGATDHITSELEKLTTRNKYHGGDQIHMASGTCVDISHIGDAIVNTPHRPILLKNILYVPRTKKNLVSINRLAVHNSIFVEFHSFLFSIKDQTTKTVLLKGRCIGGLYPLPLNEIKQACSAARCPISIWHSRLGHASNRAVEQIIRMHNLVSLQKSMNNSICDACKQAKSHLLPYSNSMSSSRFPLELVYSDVWGPALESVGRKKYYVSFIDDYSKFTSSNLNLKFFRSFKTFRPLLREDSITRS
jgi:hypothetical protein